MVLLFAGHGKVHDSGAWSNARDVSKLHELALPLREPATVRVAHAARQLDGFGEIHAHFSQRVRVRSERERDLLLRGEFEN